MSLINDALKEAQRERSGRGAVRQPGPFVENIFPYPDAAKKSLPPAVLFGAATAILIAALVVVVIVRSKMDHVGSTAKTASAARPSPSVVPKPTAPIVVQAASSSSPTPTSAPTVTPRTVAPSAATPTKPPIPPVQQANLSRPPAKPTLVAHAPTDTKPAAVTPKTSAAVSSASTTKLAGDSNAVQSTAMSASRAQAPALPDAPVAPRNDGSGVRLVIDPSGNGPADSLFRLAYAEQMKNNLDGAQGLYEKAIATRRAPAEAYNDYGVLLLGRGNKSAATEMFRQALNHDDKNVEAWVNLGDSFNGMGYHAEAMSAYARANQLDPSRPAVKARISREYEAIGDTASARRYLEDAVKASPNDAPAHYALGAYLQRARDFPGAIREFQAFVDLSAPDNQEFVVEMRRHINTLKRVAP